MAEMKGTTVGILIRIGTGEPMEVAEVEVPLRAVLRQEELNFSNGRVEANTYIDADWDGLNNDIRAALIAVAEELPVFAPNGEEGTDE